MIRFIKAVVGQLFDSACYVCVTVYAFLCLVMMMLESTIMAVVVMCTT